MARLAAGFFFINGFVAFLLRRRKAGTEPAVGPPAGELPAELMVVELPWDQRPQRGVEQREQGEGKRKQWLVRATTAEVGLGHTMTVYGVMCRASDERNTAPKSRPEGVNRSRQRQRDLACPCPHASGVCGSAANAWRVRDENGKQLTPHVQSRDLQLLIPQDADTEKQEART